MKLTVLPWKLWGLAVLLMIVVPLACACAETRYLTKEQDDEMRARCDPQGCTVIPNPVWLQIEHFLKRHGAI